MNKIKIVKGDATNPVIERGPIAVIPHVCNINGGWGKGFVLALSKKWKKPEQQYRKWSEYGEENNFKLGEIDPIFVEKEIVVVNMLAQDGFLSEENPVPINYTALVHCMESLVDWIGKFQQFYQFHPKCSIHAPFFGCGLAGGNKEVILKLIDEIWIRAGIPVTMYEWEENKSTSISTEIKFIEK